MSPQNVLRCVSTLASIIVCALASYSSLWCYFLLPFTTRTFLTFVKNPIDPKMVGILTKVLSLPTQFPLIRGMVSYAIIWPTSSIVQEYIEHGTTIESADYARAARFGIFGAFFMAPVFYGWMKYTSRFFKGKTLKTAVTRALIEQVSYSPLAMAYFFFGMSLLEMKPLATCVNEVREKFWPTYKIGVVFWPTAQTLNFYFISEKNRIVFVSAASFIFTVFMAHMKAKPQTKLQAAALESTHPVSRELITVENDPKKI